MALNMDQKRASFALGQVAWLKEKEEANNIRTQSAKFIALILNSGFLQAMDFATIKFNGAFVILNKRPCQEFSCLSTCAASANWG